MRARSPAATVNPMINAMREARQRPALKILNKIDLADPAVTEAWLAWFNAQDGVRAIGLSCKKAGESAKVLPEARKLVPHREGPLKRLRVMMMGVPNVGKSTLMKILTGAYHRDAGEVLVDGDVSRLIRRRQTVAELIALED